MTSGTTEKSAETRPASVSNAKDRARMEAQLWFAARLDLPALFATGVTDHDQREERVRQTIIAKALESATAFRTKDSGAVTFREAYQRAFGVPL